MTDIDRMPLGELRRLVAETDDVPDTATFSVEGLNRGALLLSWEDPPGSGTMTGLNLYRRCPCGHTDCPDREPVRSDMSHRVPTMRAGVEPNGGML